MRPPSISLKHPLLTEHVLQTWSWISPEYQRVATRDHFGNAFHEHLFARNENYVFQVKECTLVIPQGIVFLDGLAVEESNHRGGGVADAVPMTRSWPNVPQARKRSSTNLGTRLLTSRPKFFLAAGFDNYYHFLIESLPKLIEVLKRYPQTQVLLPRRHPEFVSRFVEKLGLDYFLVDEGSWQVSGLFVVERDPYSPLVRKEIDFLLEKILKVGSETEQGDEKLKLYISRVGSSRSLDFEEKLEKFLEARGFVVLRAEHLKDIYQNAEVFSNAKIVIGPHGAGLANIVFCSKATKVIEIATLNWWNPSFSALAQEKDLDHEVVSLEVKELNGNGNALDAIPFLDPKLID